MGGEITFSPLVPLWHACGHLYFLFISFQNTYEGVRAMDIGTVKE